MRDLTRLQKKILTKEWQRIHDIEHIDYPHLEDIPIDTYLAINDLHPCEIFHMNVAHFFRELNDKEYKRICESYYTERLDK